MDELMTAIVPVTATQGGDTGVELQVDMPVRPVAIQQDVQLVRLDQFRVDPRFAGINGQGQTVVVLDTGINLDHQSFGPDADHNGIADRIVYSFDFTGTNSSNANDVNGHGSNVASIVASQDPSFGGMAPGCNIIALKVLSDSGRGTFADIEEALKWVVAHQTAYNIVAVNMSLGDGSNSNSPVPAGSVSDEIAALKNNGVAVVCASGNSYAAYQTQGVASPSSDPNAWSIGAVWDRDIGGGVSWSSGAADLSTGPDRLMSFSQRSTVTTTIFAPGSFIVGAGPDSAAGAYVSYSGTSQATPHISGLVADMQQLAVRTSGHLMSVDDLRTTMVASAAIIFDGDDENDNVVNTNASYARVDAWAWGGAILTKLFAGTAGDDTLTGTAVGDAIQGQGGNDLLNGGAGADVLTGGAGNDVYFVDNSNDAIIENAGEGFETVYATAHFRLSANVENLVLQGGADLQAYGNDLGNALYGNAGSNLLDGGMGADTMVGGIGNDVYFVDDAGDSVIEQVGEGSDAIFSLVDFALPANVETLVLQGGANLHAYGNGLANTLYGNGGNNVLDGGGANDVMYGGAGDDVYFADISSDVVIENVREGTDVVFSTADFVLPANVEVLVLQGSADLQGFGNGDANTLYGNAGNNLLDGRGGADVMVGGAGDDRYFADNGSDAVFENAGEGNDTVLAAVHYVLSANVENLVLQGSADLQGYGNAAANSLTGNAGNNLLNGGAGADMMIGGIGNDTYFVDDGFDQVSENPGEGNDAIFSTVHFILPANVETLVLLGSNALNGTGNALPNAMFGNSADNVLDGQGAADVLTGGAGNDTFVFNVGQAGGDIIVDFTGNGPAAGDMLQFVGYGGGASFTNIDPTHWQVNFNGGASHEVITFMNAAAIDATDFLFS
jgi:Ca2+-binding RTX toxin-like protein